MPWWALTLVVAWLALGIAQVLVWQQRGDGAFSFVFRLAFGIILIPVTLAVLMFFNVQDRATLRKGRKGIPKIPTIH